MDDNFMSDFIFGSDFEKTRLHEENLMLKKRVEHLQSKLKSLSVTFEQETGREVTV